MNRRKIKNIGILLAICAFLFMGVLIQNECALAKAAPRKIKVSTGNGENGLVLKKGEKKKLSLVVTPKKANKKVVYSTSGKKIVKVSQKGVVTGVGKGSAVITVQSKAKRSVKAKLKVLVEGKNEVRQLSDELPAYNNPTQMFPPVEMQLVEDQLPVYDAASRGSFATGISLNETNLQISAGESFQLVATLTPATCMDKVTWTINFLGGINVFTNGNVFITEDTPIGTTATITAKCGKVSATCQVTVVVGPCVHTWGAWATVIPAECMAEGTERSSCEKCGKVRERAIPATGHNYLAKVVKDATCEEIGEKELVCQSCGEKTTEIIKAKGHVWETNGTVVEAPTCAKTGNMKYKCTVAGCTGEKLEPVPALGHTWDVGEITRNPTCTVNGERTFHCTITGCSGVKKESIEAMGHTWTYGEITVPPTCERGGQRVCTCLICSLKTLATVPKMGHSWDSGQVTKQPTCIGAGVRTFTCNNCGGHKTQTIDPLGHDLASTYTVDKAPTCTQGGKESRHCQRAGCSYIADIRVVPMLGHQEDAGVVTIKPDCVNAGIKTFTCQRTGCGNKRREIMKALGHDWTTYFVVTDEPTCTGTGHKAQVCQRAGCGKTRNTQLVNPLGHDWDKANSVHVDPTCTKDGSDTYRCKRTYKDGNGKTVTCGLEKMDILPATGHSFASTWTVDKKEECAQAGQKSKHCTNSWKKADGTTEKCTEKDEITVIPPLGHTWSGWTETIVPKHGVLGEEERNCSVCKRVQKRKTAKEHQYDQNGKCNECSASINLVKSTVDDWEYLLKDSDNTILLKRYIGNKPNIKIPAKMTVLVNNVAKAYDVVFAGGYEQRTQTGVFASNKRCPIQAVGFEEGVRISDMQYMFYGCEQLKAVTHIPASVVNMTGTFKGCSSLMSVCDLPSGITELSNTFEDCTSLCAAPQIPATVTSLYSTFKNCSSLAKSPTLPGKVENLAWTFSGCLVLSEAPKIPATVTDMTNTFEHTFLLAVPTDIPAGVSKLTLTFYGCLGLETVSKVPSNIEKMEYTFKSCKNLIYAKELPLTVTHAVGVFDECPNIVIG